MVDQDGLGAQADLVRAFGGVAGIYEATRPGYPAEAVDLIVAEFGIGPTATVVDLAAGTGKLTRRLVPTGATVIAVEPVAGMRDLLRQTVPGINLRPGTAEAMPLGDGSVDVVTVGQAFHWFDPEPAIAEIHRVLRDGGGLALVWNTRDEDVWPWTEVNDILERYGGAAPRHTADRDKWQSAFRRTDRFDPLQEHRFPNHQRLTLEEFEGRLASISFIAALGPAERQQALAEVSEALDAADAVETVRLSYTTEVHVTRRRVIARTAQS